MTTWADVREILSTELKFLCLMPVQPDIERHGNHYLGMGLGAAWLAGMGRYYDNPRAYHVQHFGLGSVVVVFALAALLWCILFPLRRQSYRSLLIFVGMTAPPAVLYAVPVHWFLPEEVARSVNIRFLVCLAIWRVVLLYLYLLRSVRLGVVGSLFTMLLPLTLVVTSLASLNLQHVTFEFMAGVQRMGTRGADRIAEIISNLSLLSMLLLPVSVLGYVVMIIRRLVAPPGSASAG